MARIYSIDLFTIETWKEFLDHGGDVSGFSENRRATVQRMKPDDYLLCYLTRCPGGLVCWRSRVSLSSMRHRSGLPRFSLAAFASGSSSRCVQSMVFRCLICAGN
jgi:hypothetical protein